MNKYLIVIARYNDWRQEFFESNFSPRNKEYCEKWGFNYIEIKNDTNLIKNIDLASSKNLKYLDLENNSLLNKIVLYKKLSEKMPYPTDSYFWENETKSIEKQAPSDCVIEYMQND